VRSRSVPAPSELPGIDPHELRFRYDARVKGFEEQVAGLKSSVKNCDLTRTQRRLQYLDYRTDDPVVAWARRKCKTMQTTYTEARARVEQALAQRDVSAAARAFTQLERTLTVEDDFMRTSRTRIQAMADKRSQILMEMESAVRERRATAASTLHETWPYAHDDVGLTAVRAFLQEYEAAKAQLMAMITAVQTSREVDHLETQMGTWTFAVDDAPFPDAQKLQELLRAEDPSRTATGGTEDTEGIAPEGEEA
jgi:hypothetical protein